MSEPTSSASPDAVPPSDVVVFVEVESSSSPPHADATRARAVSRTTGIISGERRCIDLFEHWGSRLGWHPLTHADRTRNLQPNGCKCCRAPEADRPAVLRAERR